MPRLIEYVSIGICSGYGDGDYRVSMAVADLSLEQMRELRTATIGAIYLMEETWRKAQEEKQRGQQATVSDKEAR